MVYVCVMSFISLGQTFSAVFSTGAVAQAFLSLILPLCAVFAGVYLPLPQIPNGTDNGHPGLFLRWCEEGRTLERRAFSVQARANRLFVLTRPPVRALAFAVRQGVLQCAAVRELVLSGRCGPVLTQRSPAAPSPARRAVNPVAHSVEAIGATRFADPSRPSTVNHKIVITQGSSSHTVDAQAFYLASHGASYSNRWKNVGYLFAVRAGRPGWAGCSLSSHSLLTPACPQLGGGLQLLYQIINRRVVHVTR